MRPKWEGAKYPLTEDCTFQNLKRFERGVFKEFDPKALVDYRSQRLFGTYFFISEEMVEHNYHSQNLSEIMAQFVALTLLIYRSMQLLGSYINKKVIVAKLMRSMYFLQRSKSQKKYQNAAFNLNIIKVDFLNKFF